MDKVNDQPRGVKILSPLRTRISHIFEHWHAAPLKRQNSIISPQKTIFRQKNPHKKLLS